MRHVFSAALLAAIAASFAVVGPAAALTTKQKSETCTFGAKDQKLTGAARKSFMAKCMANEKASKPAPAAKPKT
jgi:hypothetical protein